MRIHMQLRSAQTMRREMQVHGSTMPGLFGKGSSVEKYMADGGVIPDLVKDRAVRDHLF